ncbi:MAG: radical SAM family heme chaperone HemW [Oscillospiraceae bacterium]|nr:radical SAM family heme chaperone HemW [Oscillospiraceae bacterium]
MRKKVVGLYVHLPFCASKCNYCNFYSIPYDAQAAELYKNAVTRNVRDYTKEEQLMFDTVFFGGGTPSLLYEQVTEIAKILPLTPDCEMTAEANPCDISPKMLDVLLESGVNRLSIGVQSLDDLLLKNLGRRHDSATAIKAVELASRAGFGNISVDIMLGIPGQDFATLADTVGRLTDLPINHASAYIYEPCQKSNEDDVAKMYLQTVQSLQDKGLNQYEISNFAFLRSQCRHNLKYWSCEEYIGIGAAAHSYYGGKRFAVPDDVALFIKSQSQKTYITEETPGTFEEKTMLKLRLTDGIDLTELADDERARLLSHLDSIPAEYIRLNQKSLSLTVKGFLVANRIIGEIISSF